MECGQNFPSEEINEGFLLPVYVMDDDLLETHLLEGFDFIDKDRGFGTNDDVLLDIFI